MMRPIQPAVEPSPDLSMIIDFDCVGPVCSARGRKKGNGTPMALIAG